MYHLLPNRNFEQSPPSVFPPLDAVAWGFDFYGLWKTLEIAGVQQTMRWIPRGEFMMGSPEDEPERYSDEDLHQVKLTQGYWLADTACTQALWQAVTQHNPSHFKGDQQPVEEVSWEDVEEFKKIVVDKTNGAIRLILPTEAQWEYACRAGTDTSFNTGKSLTPSVANYDGSEPYAGEEKGLYRQKTIDVKYDEFSPNRWGLWQMHGNVLEWCQDWFGAYEDKDIAEDPTGPADGEGRVLRGGGWVYVARGCRSAVRLAVRPSLCSYNVGFRFAQVDQPRSDSTE